MELRIGNVFEKDGVTPKGVTPKSNTLIGKKVRLCSIEVGLPLAFRYTDKNSIAKGFKTSCAIEKIDQTDHGVWVTTTKSVYRFDNVCEKIENMENAKKIEQMVKELNMSREDVIAVKSYLDKNPIIEILKEVQEIKKELQAIRGSLESKKNESAIDVEIRKNKLVKALSESFKNVTICDIG